METGPSVTAFFQSLGRPIAYFPVFATKLGGVTPAVMFCQLSYWYRIEAMRDWDGWIYKTTREMYEETGLTRREQDTARSKLTELAVIETKVKGVPAKMHYKINWDAFEGLWSKLECTEAPNQFGGNVQTSMAESAKLSMAETTTKTTNRDGYPAAFEEWWAVYPRKVEKLGAFKKWKACIAAGGKLTDLQAASENYARNVVKERTEPKYIKHPSTFLGPAEPWKDWIVAKAAKVETTAKAAVRGWK